MANLVPKVDNSGNIQFTGKVAPPTKVAHILVCRNGVWTLEKIHSNILNLKAERVDPRKLPPPTAAATAAAPSTAAASAPSPAASPPAAVGSAAASPPADSNDASDEAVDEAELFGEDET